MTEGLIRGTVLDDTGPTMSRTVCHVVSILTGTKWCLAQDWLAVTVSAQRIDQACCGLWRVID